MIGDHERRAFEGVPSTAHLPHRAARAEQSFHRGRAQRDQHFGLHDLDLLDEEGQAVLHFLRSRWSVAGRARRHVGSRFQNVSDVNLFPREAHRLDNFREQLSGAADERLAPRVFVRARRFADEHDFRVGIANAEYRLGARRGEMRTERADRHAVAHFGEPLRFAGSGGRHGWNLPQQCEDGARCPGLTATSVANLLQMVEHDVESGLERLHARNIARRTVAAMGHVVHIGRMSSRLCDYDYTLPEELIAQRPLPRREDSRMMVLHRAEQRIEHRAFSEIGTVLAPGDLLVLNNTRVINARRFSDDGAIEFLFLEDLGERHWRCLVKPGRKMRIGAATQLEGAGVRVEKICADGSRIVALEREIDLAVGGAVPLPPYVRRAADEQDEERYQTVFAEVPGAVAAPTAGLHFTPELLRGLPHAFVTLHVRPIFSTQA